MNPTAEIGNVKEYATLLGQALPHVIHTEAENTRATELLDVLLHKKKRTAGEKRLAELLTLLIEEYEQKYALPEAGPIDILRHLMESNDLRQADLVDVFGTASVVSEVLKGKRGLSKSHIARLSERFHVSPALFF